jgi:hypothetical protein
MDLIQPSANPLLGHEHLPSYQVMQQNVSVRDEVNSMPVRRWGQFLGSSATLRRAVAEDDQTTVAVRGPFEVLNAWIDN